MVDDFVTKAPADVFVLVRESGGLELAETRRGELAIVTYSSIERLVAANGGGQPWARLPSQEVERLADELGASLVAVDLPPAEGAEYPEVNVTELPDLELLAPEPLPDVLYVASRPVRSWRQGAQLELQPDEQGRLLMLAYTSEELLREGCGPYQAWVSIRPENIDEAAWRSGADGVLFNPILAEQSRHEAPVTDWT